MSVRPQETRFPHRYAATIGPRKAPPARTVNLGLELLCNACPFGALLLDADGRILFANREALELLRRWATSQRNGRRVRGHLAPREIADACGRLRAGRSRTGEGLKRPNFGGRIFVPHPTRSNLSAVVALERSPRDRRVALFCVFLHDRLQENLVSGRRDHLAMLTLAERRVAKLVVDGLRNHEIASLLGKSVSTVKSQLAATFSKLSIRSRVQLTTLLRGV